MSYTKIDILRQTAGMIATALGDGWSVDTDRDIEWSTSLNGPNGAQLFIASADRTYDTVDRLEISCTYNRVLKQGTDTPYGTTYPKITVKRDRGPDVIAREITRRLLPEYLPQLTKVQGSVSEDESAFEARVILARRLGETGELTMGRRAATSVRLRGPGMSYGDADISYRGDSVHLKLAGITADSAVAILALLADSAEQS